VRFLIGSITSFRLGCHFAGNMINLLCFVDDMVLLAPSWSSLQIFIDKLQQEALTINMTFNISETVCMILSQQIVVMQYVISFHHSMRVGGYFLVQHSLDIWDTLCAMTCVMRRKSKEKLRVYSHGAIYFLVDSSVVRVLSRYDYFKRTACVFFVQYCGLHLHLGLYSCLYLVLTNERKVYFGMPSVIGSQTCLLLWI